MRSRTCRERRYRLRCWRRRFCRRAWAGYEPAGLDTLIAAGEVTWAGVEPLGERDGRIALYLTDKLPLLAPVRSAANQEPLTRAGTETAGGARVERGELL